MTQELDLQALRKVAEAATPGPWTEFHENGTQGEFEPFNCPPATGAMLLDYAPMEQRAKDAKFIATFDPPTVLALLTQLEQAEAQVARVRELASEFDKHEYPRGMHRFAVAKRIRRALDGESI